ncbi:hypothetical protein NNO_1513 [Hydrogenimonas sp.]|nr:hypothetical protein NNO_1513 [Hydrogenimonas sp.]
MSKIGILQTTTKNESEKRVVKSKKALVAENFTHCAIVGQTGCGKTSSAILPNIEERISEGHGILVYDYKGNQHAQVKALAKKYGRLDDVTMIGVPWGKKVNIVEKMSLGEIENMLAKIMGMKKDDKYWERSALNILMPIFELHRKIERLQCTLGEIGKEMDFTIRDGETDYANPPTIKGVLDAIPSLAAIKSYVNGYDSLKRHLLEQYKNLSESGSVDDFAQKRFVDLIRHIDKISKAHTQYKNVDTTRYTTFSSIYTCIDTLAIVGKHDMFNSAEADIVDELNEGKIVILNTTGLAEAALQFLTHSIFENLKERFLLPFKKPVSVFIDEAQKVLDKELEIPIDTMREAKVDVFMAFQSQSLIRERLGSDGYESLHANLTTKLVYKSDQSFDGVETEDLEDFEYLTNMDGYREKYRAEPLFLTKEELFEAEWSYQKSRGIFDRYLLDKEIDERFIFVYFPKHYENDFIHLRFEDGKNMLVEFIDISIDLEAIGNGEERSSGDNEKDLLSEINEMLAGA